MNTQQNPNETEHIPYFFFIGDKYTIGTSRGINKLDKTVDVCFNDLANSYNLQSKLNLGSLYFIRPVWNPPLAYPLEGQELIKHSANFLATFTNDQKEREEKRDYLKKNGLVRILILDNQMLKEVKEIISKINQ